MNRYTRRPEAIPLADITAETVARGFVDGWIARFGYHGPGQGIPKFSLHSPHTRILGARRICTTAYHTLANGMVESLHRQLKAGLSARWIEHLSVVYSLKVC